MLTACILGVGSAGRRHRDSYIRLGVKIAALYEPFDFPPLKFCDPTRTIQKADIVSIASPDDFHVDQAIMAMEAGKHVFCEKPISHNVADYARFAAACKTAHGKIACNLPLRHLPLFVAFKERLTGGFWRDDCELIEATYHWGRAWKMRGWRGRIPDYSPTLGGGVHMIDLLRYLCGPDITVLQSTRDRSIRPRDICANLDVGGIRGRLLVDFTDETGEHYQEIRIERHPSKLNLLAHNASEIESFDATIGAFLDAIKNDMPTNLADAMAAHEIAYAIDRLCGSASSSASLSSEHLN